MSQEKAFSKEKALSDKKALGEPKALSAKQAQEPNALHWLRSLAFFLGYALLTLIYGTLSLLLWVFPHKFRYRLIISWTYLVIYWARITCGLHFQVKGLKNRPPRTQNVIVLSKHQSTWETLFLQGFFAPSVTVLKKQLLKIPFFGWGLAALRPIAIDRDKPREALRMVKEKGVRRLQQGFNLILFPEGTRSRPGERGRYARSGAEIALASDHSILPIAVNAGHLWKPGRFAKLPGLITVSIGPAIEIQGRTSREIMSDVETWIENEMQIIDTETL